jgi:hypothetical protein
MFIHFSFIFLGVYESFPDLRIQCASKYIWRFTQEGTGQIGALSGGKWDSRQPGEVKI